MEYMVLVLGGTMLTPPPPSVSRQNKYGNPYNNSYIQQPVEHPSSYPLWYLHRNQGIARLPVGKNAASGRLCGFNPKTSYSKLPDGKTRSKKKNSYSRPWRCASGALELEIASSEASGRLLSASGPTPGPTGRFLLRNM